MYESRPVNGVTTKPTAEDIEKIALFFGILIKIDQGIHHKKTRDSSKTKNHRFAG